MQHQPGFRSPVFSLFGTRPLAEIAHTFAWFEEMRESQPVLRDETLPMPVWQVFRYADVLTVLKDSSRFSSQAYGLSGDIFRDTLIAKDPPDHRKLHNLVNQAFTPRAVARLSERITQITQELLDQVRQRGTMDVVADFAFPLPAKVIAELLGVPPEDWNIFQRGRVSGTPSRGRPSREAGAVCARTCSTTSRGCSRNGDARRGKI